MAASVAASVATAQCEPGRTDREDGGGRHLQISSAASVRALESASSSNSSLTSGYSSDSPADLTDKGDPCHSRSTSNGNTTTRETTFGNDTYSSSSSSSSIPLEPPPSSSEKNCQCFSELSSQSRMDSSPLAPSSRQRKFPVTKLSQTVSNTVLVGDGSVSSSMQSPDARLQVTDLVLSDSDDEDDDDDVAGDELYSCKLRHGYPFTDEAVSESDYETDSSLGSHSNSRRSSVSHWN